MPSNRKNRQKSSCVSGLDSKARVSGQDAGLNSSWRLTAAGNLTDRATHHRYTLLSDERFEPLEAPSILRFCAEGHRLKKWLVEYKFKDWDEHGTDPAKLGTVVTDEEKNTRAEEIARLLGDTKRWHSHGRIIGIDTVRNELRLRVDDYSTNAALRGLIRAYNDLMMEYIMRSQYPVFMHSRNYF
jgi:hypothetical protein